MADIHRQLELLGLDGAIEQVRARTQSSVQTDDRKVIPLEREIERLKAAHTVMSALPDHEDLVFLHSALCQTALPHRRLASDDEIWSRSAGRLHLMISPGVIHDPETNRTRRVGVPYGNYARLIMLYLQSKGRESRFVELGPTMSSWMKSLGLKVTGGEKGTIKSFKEQSLRISRSEYTIQWDGPETGSASKIKDQRIVSDAQLSLWSQGDPEASWSGAIELDESFHLHLREHAVPLDQRAIRFLSNNSLALDVYTFLAYRLRRLPKGRPLRLSWEAFLAQSGSAGSSFEFGRQVRAVLPNVLAVYPEARVDEVRGGLVLHASPPPVPETKVSMSGSGSTAVNWQHKAG